MAGDAEAEREVTCPGSTLKWFSGLGRDSGWGPRCSSILCPWSQQAAQRFACSTWPVRCRLMSSGLGRAEGAPGRTRLGSGGPASPRPPGGPFSTARGGPCGRGAEGGTTTGREHGAGKPLGARRRAQRGAEGYGAAAAGLRGGGGGELRRRRRGAALSPVPRASVKEGAPGASPLQASLGAGLAAPSDLVRGSSRA